MKHSNSKALLREHYVLLAQLGIEIVMYDLKTFVEKERNTYGFEVHGCLEESVDFDELLELLKLIKIAKDTENPVVIDALEHLKTVIGITNEQR